MRSARLSAWASIAAAVMAGDDRLRSRQDNNADSGDGESSGRPTDAFRRRAMQQIVAMGDYLYFTGGEISNYYNGTKEDDDASPSLTINSTMAVDLTKSWSNETMEFIQTQHDEPGPINMHALWADPDSHRLYRWGGSTGPGTDMSEDDVRLWAFTADDNGTGTWETQDPFDQKTFDDLVGVMGGAPASCDGKGYYIGGYGRSSSDPSFAGVSHPHGIPVPGILSYDFDRRQWRNDTTVPMNPDYGEKINANAHCATGFEGGDVDGSLVFLVGGANTAPDDVSHTVPGSMTNVSFWNPGAERWYAQSTTGEAPNAREHFCIAGARGRDSYEIFVYGGENPKTGLASGINILSIPSFHWFRAEVESPGRIHHACTVAGKRQMISTGGVTSEWDWEEQDLWRHSIGVFDMTELEWRDNFDPDAGDYETPQMIRDWYDDEFKASSMEWDDDAVKELFYATGDLDDGASDSDSEQQSSTSTPVGAIAGGVVGGVVGIALIGGLIFLLLRRRRARGEAIELESPTEDTKPTDASSSLPSTQFSGMAYGQSPVGSNSYTTPSTTGATGRRSEGYSQAPVEMPTTELDREVLEMPTVGHERVEMPTTELSREVLEMPTLGHGRVEMEDNGRRELQG